MKILDLFGVRANTLDEANGLAERAVGEKSLACENSNYGDYYRFGDYRAECLKVIQNEDMYDGLPCHENGKEYKFIILLQEAPVDSNYLLALEKHPESFVKLESKTY